MLGVVVFIMRMLSYFDTVNYARKIFITLIPQVNVLSIFTLLIYGLSEITHYQIIFLCILWTAILSYFATTLNYARKIFVPVPTSLLLYLWYCHLESLMYGLNSISGMYFVSGSLIRHSKVNSVFAGGYENFLGCNLHLRHKLRQLQTSAAQHNIGR